MKKLLLLSILTFFTFAPSFSGTTELRGEIVHVEPFTQKVYITKTGAKYHLGSCRHLKQSKIEIAKSKARERGYTACKVCKP